MQFASLILCFKTDLLTSFAFFNSSTLTFFSVYRLIARRSERRACRERKRERDAAERDKKRKKEVGRGTEKETERGGGREKEGNSVDISATWETVEMK